jgi:dTDP-4-amino-4,6-dideoxygalactose transaminase
MTGSGSVSAEPIPFIDLATQRRRLASSVDAAIARVLDHGQYILGPEVGILEADLARFCRAREVITCANGTDALALILMATGVTTGDAVLCPSFTFAATAEAVAWMGATPIFVDVLADTFNMDPQSLEQGIAAARRQRLRPVCAIVVDLFGQPADYDSIESICAAHGMWVLADAAQSFGASYRRRKVGTIGRATATSFFPAKPLGCYGDGGAVFTDDAGLAHVIRSLRVHGQGRDKYENVRVGMNGRLDTIQAAVLIEKLKIFSDEIARRDAVARRYSAALGNFAIVPRVIEGLTSVWAQYTIRVPAGRRDATAAALKAAGIPTAIHYARPLHRQSAYREFPTAQENLPVSEAIAGEVLSLPMHPYLEAEVQEHIINALQHALA